jgi:hypothetical protein
MDVASTQAVAYIRSSTPTAIPALTAVPAFCPAAGTLRLMWTLPARRRWRTYAAAQHLLRSR